MEPDEVLKRAWEAVKAADLPESMQETAFREAVEILKEGAGAPTKDSSQKGAARSTSGGKKPPPKAGRRRIEPPVTPMLPVPDEAVFFSELSDESGVPETDLRDILQLAADGTVAVTPPTRRLGRTTAEQARTVVPLVAAARLIGLKENPVSAAAVRRELQRKNCYDQSNFGATVLGKLAGFNYGSTNGEIVATSKWVADFTAAVDRAHGRGGEATEKE